LIEPKFSDPPPLLIFEFGDRKVTKLIMVSVIMTAHNQV
jgi:hypothetical protein